MSGVRTIEKEQQVWHRSPDGVPPQDEVVEVVLKYASKTGRTVARKKMIAMYTGGHVLRSWVIKPAGETWRDLLSHEYVTHWRFVHNGYDMPVDDVKTPEEEE